MWLVSLQRSREWKRPEPQLRRTSRSDQPDGRPMQNRAYWMLDTSTFATRDLPGAVLSVTIPAPIGRLIGAPEQ